MQGHTAHVSQEEAGQMVDTILEWYRGIYEYLLAIPVICGTKSKKEKFAGADDTKTVEARHQATLCGACICACHVLSVCHVPRYSNCSGCHVHEWTQPGM